MTERITDFLSLELQNIIQEYIQPSGEKIRVIDDISINFDKPMINMLLGPSGCGKSTLLRMMGGVRPFGVKTPTSGAVLIGNTPFEGAHNDVVMVFQKYANRPDLTVRENIEMPFTFKLWKKSVTTSEVKKRVDDIVEAVGLSDKQNLRPSQISGGQNQRVALARALVLRPKILLMDEPFGALDAQTRVTMQTLFKNLVTSYPCTVIFVTHDVTEAIMLGDRVIVLSANPGKIADDFLIAEQHPRNNSSVKMSYYEQRIISKLHSIQNQSHIRVSV